MTPEPNRPDRDVVLRIEDLSVTFHTEEGRINAVRHLDVELRRGDTLALVGESGSGKSVTAASILRLIQRPGRIAGGKITVFPRRGDPVEVTALSDKDDRLYQLRGGLVSMIFQEPMTALSPVHTVGNQIVEAILLHGGTNKRHAKEKAREMLDRVGIPEPGRCLRQYPHELSGGMRQRAVIAMALVCEPEILIADEPTTALDVTVQAQILKLIEDLKADFGASVLFITHDLGVVAQISDRVVVMNRGRIMEEADTRDLFRTPLHPYTRKLLAAVPRLDPGEATSPLRPAPAAEALLATLPEGWRPDEHDGVGTPRLHPIEDRKLLLWKAAPATPPPV